MMRVEKRLTECPVERVTVFTDRAEVSRRVEFVTESGGNTSVVLVRAPASIDLRSIRVSQGTGDFTIMEVTSALISGDGNAECTVVTEAAKRLDAMRETLAKYAADKQMFEAEKSWLAAYMARVADSRKESPVSYEAATKQLSWFRDESRRIEGSIADTCRAIKKVEEDIAAAEKATVASASESKKLAVSSSIEISVLINTAKPEKGAMTVSYLVAGASWLSSYDMRLNSTDGSLQVTYYSSITNTSGDEWTDARVSLSTAMPSAGGEPPTLTTLRARQLTSPSASEFSDGSSVNPLFMNRLVVAPMGGHSSGRSPSSSSSIASAARVLTAAVEKTVASVTFSIQCAATILSDGVPHKLTVAVAVLHPTLSCTMIPVLAPTAFLRANCGNSCGFPLLAGPVSVFIDNNFVTNTRIKHTNQDDMLDVFLGVDPSVVVEFKPPRETTTESGLIRRTKTKEVTHRTTVKNTKGVPVEVSLFDQLPLSVDEKVKVKSIDPDLALEPETLEQQGVLLNDHNNVRWTLNLAPGEERTISFRYTIEFPRDKQIELY